MELDCESTQGMRVQAHLFDCIKLSRTRFATRPELGLLPNPRETKQVPSAHFGRNQMGYVEITFAFCWFLHMGFVPLVVVLVHPKSLVRTRGPQPKQHNKHTKANWVGAGAHDNLACAVSVQQAAE